MRLEGKPIAEKIRARIKEKASRLNRQPVLLTISAAPNEATLAYIRSQEKQAKLLGISYRHLPFEKDVTMERLLAEIERINLDKEVDAVLLSHPMPKHVDELLLLTRLSPEKDAEGRGPVNLGRIAYEKTRLYPCTAKAVIEFMDYYGIPIHGERVAIVGRSTTIGKPLSWMLLEKAWSATPTVCHTKTKDLAQIIAESKVVVVATGVPQGISLSGIQTGAYVIDVGINVVDGKIVGDVFLDPELEMERQISITPTPGGVGPVTSLLLMEHAFICAMGSVKA